jgi:hypothetical protein
MGYYFGESVKKRVNSVDITQKTGLGELRARFIRAMALFHPDKLGRLCKEHSLDLEPYELENLRKESEQVTQIANRIKQLTRLENISETQQKMFRVQLMLTVQQLQVASRFYLDPSQKLSEYKKILEVCLVRLTDIIGVNWKPDSTTEPLHPTSERQDYQRFLDIASELQKTFREHTDSANRLGQYDSRHFFEIFDQILIELQTNVQLLSQIEVHNLVRICQVYQTKLKEITNHLKSEVVLRNPSPKIVHNDLLLWQHELGQALVSVLDQNRKVKSVLGDPFRILQNMW